MSDSATATPPLSTVKDSPLATLLQSISQVPLAPAGVQQATAADLELINRFAVEKLAADDVYVFECAASSDACNSYHMRMADSSLANFVQDGMAGTPLLVGHDDVPPPVGRSFEARQVTADGSKLVVLRMFMLRDYESGSYKTDELALRTEWARTVGANNTMAALSEFQLTYNQAAALVLEFGENAVIIVRRNPYILIGKIPGFGFKRTDVIARKCGMAKTAPDRIRAGLIHCVNEALDDGNCYVEYRELLARADKLLILDDLNARDLIEADLDWLLEQGTELVCYSVPDSSEVCVARKEIHQQEILLAELFSRQAGEEAQWQADCDKGKAQDAAWKYQVALNRQQWSAFTNALNHPVSLISGGAGTGKTYTVAAIADICCDILDLTVLLAAPTGKAARRIEESVHKQTGQEWSASTIHKLLGYNGTTFTRSAMDPLEADVVIIDEFSMVDVPLAARLFQAIDLKRTSVVIVGDHNQLPPVGPGNILRDLVSSAVVPMTLLDECVRQAGPLKQACQAILAGSVIRVSSTETPAPWVVAMGNPDPLLARQYIMELFSRKLKTEFGFSPLTDVQVLTPTHKGPLGTYELNTELQHLVQEHYLRTPRPRQEPGRRHQLYPGDKIIQTKNDYELGLMNGAIGVVISAINDVVVADFDGVQVDIPKEKRENIGLAYALTIHKAQGSEFPCAVVVVHRSHSYQHHRNLLYTAATRAQTTTILVGDKWAIDTCAQRTQSDRRKTFLSLLLNVTREGSAA